MRRLRPGAFGRRAADAEGESAKLDAVRVRYAKLVELIAGEVPVESQRTIFEASAGSAPGSSRR